MCFEKRFLIFHDFGHFLVGPASAKRLPGSHLEQSEAMDRGPSFRTDVVPAPPVMVGSDQARSSRPQSNCKGNTLKTIPYESIYIYT